MEKRLEEIHCKRLFLTWKLWSMQTKEWILYGNYCDKFPQCNITNIKKSHCQTRIAGWHFIFLNCMNLYFEIINNWNWNWKVQYLYNNCESIIFTSGTIMMSPSLSVPGYQPTMKKVFNYVTNFFMWFRLLSLVENFD